MKRLRMCCCVTAGLFAVATGCSSGALSKEDRKIHMVNVAYDVVPRQILASRGDEIQWHNSGTQPIVVSFPASIESRISCLNGFKREQESDLLARIDSNASASLCFVQQGKYNYQIRLGQNRVNPLTDQRASVWIVGRGERQPDPYEEYTNITP